MARRQPHPRHVLNNWREHDGTFAEKVELLLRNNWKKVRTGSQCCGRHGEPGC